MKDKAWTIKQAKNSRVVASTTGTSSIFGKPFDSLINCCSGSAGTQNSASSSGLYDTSSSSARFSSSSTLPSSSSLEASKDDPQPHPQSRSPQHVPVPPVPTSSSGFSLLGSSRTFSFGARKATQAARQPNNNNNIIMPEQNSKYTDIPDVEPNLRSRAMTETSHASTSTATPPKLFDGELNLSFTEEPDGFGNMFDGFDMSEKRKSRGLEGRQNQRSVYSWTCSYTKLS